MAIDGYTILPCTTIQTTTTYMAHSWAIIFPQVSHTTSIQPLTLMGSIFKAIAMTQALTASSRTSINHPSSVHTSNASMSVSGLTELPKWQQYLLIWTILGLISLFLDLVSWGDLDCITHPKIRYERSVLMVTEELPLIIAWWHQPPWFANSMHVRAHGATTLLECFAFNCVGDVIGNELKGIRDVLQCPPEDLSMKELYTLFVEDPILKLSSPGFCGTLKLWFLLLGLVQSNKQQSHNISKVPDMVCTYLTKTFDLGLIQII